MVIDVKVVRVLFMRDEDRAKELAHALSERVTLAHSYPGTAD